MEWEALKETAEVSRKSSLIHLRPYLDSDGLMRVGGRLGKADITATQKHPDILHRVDNLLCKNVHQSNLHVGPTTLLSLLCLRYHIIGVKQLVKDVSKKCVTCQKAYARTTAQLMGQLPSSWVTPAPPFTHTGADFAGPFLLKKGHTRKPLKVKGYVCLFVFMTTKATHLELVMDLTSEAFIAALKCFVARRGCLTTFD